MAELLGPVGSSYPLQRAHFKTEVEGKHIDIFLTNREHKDWQDGVTFYDYLKSHPKALEEYRLLKESMQGATVRDYYRRKI